ncbi:putative small auxin-up RNA [Helianthus annuus]|uniref:Small auxin-up RNA n=1 Tax=Helianthus annuus TaxID=4232 RepID=A0A251RNH7_HELAN|nr:putative small auxin-up RNA [Helianthus annuus]KAJ0428490.1 putative small auxin-up RNA [Helianthus annuus]KAJ0432588.1 putative small auxin-up RNA [Helianthus annuus]KAJ0446830.1 putative small auxin-up RNA [Helianthus annuus]KAJ0631724.1 putative small auxin-up RNA [Helianthus annuus]
MGSNKFPKIMYTYKLAIGRYLSSSTVIDVPKGHFSVYVGENCMKRFIIPLSYLKHPLFQTLLNMAKEEFGYTHPMGGLTFPCKEETFNEIIENIQLEGL